MADKLNLLPVKKFVEKHDSFATNGGMRHLIFNKETNGFKKVIKKIGRRVLIDEDEFFEWVKENN